MFDRTDDYEEKIKPILKQKIRGQRGENKRTA